MRIDGLTSRFGVDIDGRAPRLGTDDGQDGHGGDRGQGGEHLEYDTEVSFWAFLGGCGKLECGLAWREKKRPPVSLFI